MYCVLLQSYKGHDIIQDYLRVDHTRYWMTTKQKKNSDDVKNSNLNLRVNLMLLNHPRRIYSPRVTKTRQIRFKIVRPAVMLVSLKVDGIIQYVTCCQIPKYVLLRMHMGQEKEITLTVISQLLEVECSSDGHRSIQIIYSSVKWRFSKQR